MNVYPDNSISKFSNKLETPLELNRQWEVALKELIYPTEFGDQTASINISSLKNKYAEYTITFRDGEDIQNIINKFNEKIDLFNQTFNPSYPIKHVKISSNKIIIRGGKLDNFTRIFPCINNKQLITIFGFDIFKFNDQVNGLLSSSPSYYIRSQNSPNSKLMNFLHVTTDIIHPHMVGEKRLNILRIVPFGKVLNETLSHQIIDPPYYYPVRFNMIQDITLEFNDQFGQPLKFKNGRVHAVLHFRKII